MILALRKSAAVAVATFFFFALTGADTSLARAQENPSAAVVAAVELQVSDAPRFVAEPVVQAVPLEPAEAATDIPLTLGELVTDMPVDQELSRDMRCLAQAIYFEARGEPLAGQLAVGRVIVNRAESGAFPSDYCGVVTQRGQFSFVKGGHIPEPSFGSAAWRKAVAVAQIAHRELWDSPVKDALYFHATYVRPRWSRTKVARATIDRHIFYR
ncbi:cell wall hydrolase [Tsuneonella sp. HG222]